VSLSSAKPIVRIILILMGGIVLYCHTVNYRIRKVKLSDRETMAPGFVTGFLDVLGGGG